MCRMGPRRPSGSRVLGKGPRRPGGTQASGALRPFCRAPSATGGARGRSQGRSLDSPISPRGGSPREPCPCRPSRPWRPPEFYVMMAPQDVLQSGSPRSIAPRTHPYSPRPEGPRTPRDERRRAQHNEVERRRRDKINNWIVQLSKIVPEGGGDGTKSGASKGGILSKACDYIRELRQSNQRLQETRREGERLQRDNERLRQQVEQLRSEQALLRGQLLQRGLEAPEGPAP